MSIKRIDEKQLLDSMIINEVAEFENLNKEAEEVWKTSRNN